MFLRQGLVLAVGGVCLGLGAASALTRQIQSLSYGVSPNDSLTFAGAAVVVLAAALLACYFPARRAALMNPIAALRHD
jgi:putative ABC transport system permease protein